jgi:hypothetical protein
MPIQPGLMNTREQAKEKLNMAWPYIVDECRKVLGSELHYQAIVYHCLRQYGEVAIGQIGMNVKIGIINPKTEFYKSLDARRQMDYQGMVEPIPDVCLFMSKVGSDWRRRKHKKTLASLLLAIEIKASERRDGRLHSGEIIFDIKKLAALRQEAHGRLLPVVMIIDTAKKMAERMTPYDLLKTMEQAKEFDVALMYVSRSKVRNTLVDV